MAARDVDPLVGFQFALQIDDIRGYFVRIEGIGTENAPVTHKVVTNAGKELTLQIPGRTDGGQITLHRGLTQNLEFWMWREAVIQGDMARARRDGTIIMFNRAYEEVRRWHFLNAWPSKITGPQIASDSNDLGIEELTIMHEGLYAEGPALSVPTHEPPVSTGA